MPKPIIISDLDGTLLDSRDYSFTAALPALARIRAQGVPLVLCSSKTRAEIEIYRCRLANHHPFISENGGGIFIPKGYFSQPFDAEESGSYQLIRLGTPYAEICDRFGELRRRLGSQMRGFAEMSVPEIVALTGLSSAEADLARQRDFDEVFTFVGPPDQAFLRAIEAEGLRWTQGQFFHLMGDHDKGRAVQLLLSLYRREYGAVTSVGLGDGFNDLPLLVAVDRPVLIRHADGGYERRVAIPGLIKSRYPGPMGWNDTLLPLLAMESDEQLAAPVREIFQSALDAVDPYLAVLKAVTVEANHLRLGGATYNLADFKRVFVIGAGKATARMSLAIEELLGERLNGGLVIVKHGHSAPLAKIEQIEAAHPVPDQAGEEGARRVLALARAADSGTLLLCLLSGGASALLVAPAEGLTLQDKQLTTELLLKAGAPIDEVNAVRKHLSALKGGRLARAAFPAHLLTLLLSDVIGDRLEVIASGPTAPDPSTFAEAWAVLGKYDLQARVPESVGSYLQRGMAGQEVETVKAGDPAFATTRNVIIGGIGVALAAAAEKAQQLGFAPEIVSATLQGEARAAAHFLGERLRAGPASRAAERWCLLSGGETTVTVKGRGKGGRNQELALAFALAVEGLPGLCMLSAGSDGSDGPTDAAGAVVSGATVGQARRVGLAAEVYLANNDSYTFFHDLDAASGGHSHLKTGPTGTNVMDIQIILCQPETAAREAGS